MQIQTVPGADGMPHSPAAILGGLIFTSGHVGTDATGTVADGFEKQMRCAMDNLVHTLRLSGGSLASVASARLYITESSYFDEMNTIYFDYMPTPLPARTTVVAQLADSSLLFEIEVVAHVV